MPEPVIRSDGDLEAVALHEGHDLLARLIGPTLYQVGGIAPNHQVTFHSQQTYELFVILLMEFVAEGSRSVFIEERFQNHSLLTSLAFVAAKYPNESRDVGLDRAVSDLENWLRRQVLFDFWYPDGDVQVEFELENSQLVTFAANGTKHRLFRLSNLTDKVFRFCEAAGYNFTDQQAYSVLRSMMEEVHSRLVYHSTYIVELSGRIFFSLNALIKHRFEANPTNVFDDIAYPEGITSEVFRNLYAETLVFKRYADQRIWDHTPATSDVLKLRYQ